jgi:fatty acid CoA ligase FadD22
VHDGDKGAEQGWPHPILVTIGPMTGGAGENLAADLARLAERSGWWDRPAFMEGGKVLTHGQVHDGAARVAGALRREGVGPGDRVLIALPDSRWFVWSFLGAVRLGALAVPVNPGLSGDEHAFLTADAEPAAVVCGEEQRGRFRGRAAVLSPGELLVGEPAPVHPARGEDAAYAQYTSGTTGRPKAAVHRHADPHVYHQAMAVGALGMTGDDLVLSVSKAYFAYGLGNTVFFPLLSGAAGILWAERPTPEGVEGLVREHRPSLLFAVPSFYALLVARADPSPFACLRAAVSAGETLTPALLERAEGFLCCPVLDGLGSTEVGQTFISNTLERRRPGSVGVVLPGYEVRVGDGTLWVKGRSVMKEYWHQPQATAEALQGGFLRTGDRARLDEEGFVWHEGRNDDMEMVGGIKVSPIEVEAVLGTHPAVAEVAVAAVPDELGATRLRAFVVPAPNCLPPDRLAQELLDLARCHLAPFKVPRSVRLVERLPRTPTGKLQRFVLRASWP